MPLVENDAGHCFIKFRDLRFFNAVCSGMWDQNLVLVQNIPSYLLAGKPIRSVYTAGLVVSNETGRLLSNPSSSFLMTVGFPRTKRFLLVTISGMKGE